MDLGGSYGTSGMGRQESPPSRGRADTGFRRAITVQARASDTSERAECRPEKRSAGKRGENPAATQPLVSTTCGCRGGGSRENRAAARRTPPLLRHGHPRSEDRRVGKEWVSTSRTRGTAYP